MVDFGKSDKMIKLSGKVNKLNTYNGFSINISFFIYRTSTDCVWFIHFPLSFIILSDSPKFTICIYNINLITFLSWRAYSLFTKFYMAWHIGLQYLLFHSGLPTKNRKSSSLLNFDELTISQSLILYYCLRDVDILCCRNIDPGNL